MNFWEKIRSLPLTKRKAILWVIIVILGIILMNWWLRDLFQKLENPELLHPEIPPINFEKAFEDIPEFHIPPELLEELEEAASEENSTSGEEFLSEDIKENN